MAGPRAGLAYFAIVFACGFILGTIRVLTVVPRLGELGAVLIELPVMLAISWWVCGRLLRRYRVASFGARTSMGASAFVLLIAAELFLSVIAFGRTPSAFFAAYGTAAGAGGLAGQVMFALWPLIRRPA